MKLKQGGLCGEAGRSFFGTLLKTFALVPSLSEMLEEVRCLRHFQLRFTEQVLSGQD